MSSLEASIISLWTKIHLSKKILLINHIRMDPDAFWSLCAFYMVCKKLWKEVKAINDEKPPENFLLFHDDIFEPHLNIKKFNPDLIISFDAGGIEQLGKTYINNNDIFDKKDFVVIDHHITNPWFWKTNIIDVSCSSTCELIYDILEDLSMTHMIDSQVATLLLCGIHTDTNTFYNKNTTPKTLRIAARLLELWGHNKEVIFQFFRKKSFERAKLWGSLLKKIKKTRDGKIVWISIHKRVYSHFSIGEQWIKWFLNEFLANIEGCVVAMLLYELEEGGGVKWSLRSNHDDVDVSEVCVDMWGGGHKLAAWFAKQWDIKHIEGEIMKKLRPLVKRV
jgi:bifunctional oligoribonuclease and PAP phosphatase NrnA